jgi:hypothetical protein
VLDGEFGDGCDDAALETDVDLFSALFANLSDAEVDRGFQALEKGSMLEKHISFSLACPDRKFLNPGANPTTFKITTTTPAL